MEPTKAVRKSPIQPHYKAMWQEECKRAQGYAVACGDLRAIVLARETARRSLGSDLIGANLSRNRWATVAAIEALALGAGAIILLAR